jgi:hypothetical protein
MFGKAFICVQVVLRGDKTGQDEDPLHEAVGFLALQGVVKVSIQHAE